MQLACKHLHHHIAFIQAQQAVIYKHAGQLVSNGAVNQGGCNRRIHTTRQTKDDLFITHLLTNFDHGFFNVVAHDPVWAGATNVEHKTIQQRLPLDGVRDFRVKLHGIKTAGLIGHTCNRASRRGRHDLKAFRQLSDFVTVAHPDLEHAKAFRCGKVFNALKQFGMTVRTNLCVTKFAGESGFYLAPQLCGHGLHTIANAQHRQAQLKHRVWRAVVYFVHTGVASRQNDAL